jgi:hypothetical protein
MPRRTDISMSPSPPSGGEGRGEGGVRVAAKLDEYGPEHSVEVFHHVRVAETQNSKALVGERLRSRAIIGLATGMGVAIELNDEALRAGGKVGDVRCQNDLLLKFHAEAISADSVPKAQFRLGEISSQLLGAMARFGVPFHTPPSPCRCFASAFPLHLKGARGIRHLPNQIHEGSLVNA